MVSERGQGPVHRLGHATKVCSHDPIRQSDPLPKSPGLTLLLPARRHSLLTHRVEFAAQGLFVTPKHAVEICQEQGKLASAGAARSNAITDAVGLQEVRSSVADHQSHRVHPKQRKLLHRDRAIRCATSILTEATHPGAGQVWPVTSLSDRQFSDRDGASSRSIGADTILGHETGRIGIAGGNAGGGHGFAGLFASGDF